MTRQPKAKPDLIVTWSTERDGFGDGPPAAASLDRLHFEIEPKGVISTSVDSPRPRTISCDFRNAPERTTNTGIKTVAELGKSSDSDGKELNSGESSYKHHCQLAAPNTSTRMRPPRDIIKLADRLRLLLQPPLESLIAAAALRFAHNPFNFQLDGIAFLYPRQRAVLADEMGLGKTMQAITAVRLLVHHGELRRVLLVCPKPLVTNWQREFDHWAPELPVSVIEGSPARRQWMWRSGGNVVTIANYETVIRDRDDVCHADNHYDLVLLDESQRIKNASSTTNEVVRSIPRARSWALTGTPIENSIDDLRGIFEFIAPGQVDINMKPRAVGRAVADHVLRRTKSQVNIDLPPKMFRDADVVLTPEQAESYRLAEDEGVIHLRELQQQLTIQHVFELVLRLKQICNFDPATGESSKFERLETDLEECAASGQKAIVFSQWTDTLDELGYRLARFRPVEYSGKVPAGKRDAVIAKFRDDPTCNVILMSYGAGGVGLNLQFASYVFLYDRWWNPAVEDQAVNRAHRIGAKRSVTITRFLTLNTIEQRIQDVLDQKRALFDAVFHDDLAAPSAGLSREEIFSLFGLGPKDAPSSRAA